MRTPSPRVGPFPGTSAPAATPGLSRRRFLFALGAGGAGAAAAATTPALAAAAAPAEASAPATTGYRETDHVRDYYATTRL